MNIRTHDNYYASAAKAGRRRRCSFRSPGGATVLRSTDEALTSCAEFTVQKVSPRHTDVVRRTLCLTETCLVERDPATYNVATCRPLSEVRTLTDRPAHADQRQKIIYMQKKFRNYMCINVSEIIYCMQEL